MTARFTGQSVLITGAASGIGLATAYAFAEEEALLTLADVDAGGLETIRAEVETKTSVELVSADVGLDADVERMVSAAVRRWGRLDVAVANAGVFNDSETADTTAESWDRVTSTDALGTFLTCKHAAAVMLERGGGAIVCVSSISGLAGQQRQAGYGPAKFVASGLTAHLSAEFAAKGIRVNAVAPGTIRTAGLSQVPPEIGERLLVAHPMKRFGEPHEVARAVVFLASDDPSFIAGAVLPVDGGYLAR